jgi:H+-transporting ATPase
MGTPIASATGLTNAEARRRQAVHGPNAIEEKTSPRWRIFLSKFGSPIPLLLGVAAAVEIGLGAYVEAGVIAALLLFNAVLGFIQEGRATAVLAALKQRLAPVALVVTTSAEKVEKVVSPPMNPVMTSGLPSG